MCKCLQALYERTNYGIPEITLLGLECHGNSAIVCPLSLWEVLVLTKSYKLVIVVLASVLSCSLFALR